MKLFIGSLFLLFTLGCGVVLSLPATTSAPKDDAEVIDTDPDYKDFKGVIDTGVGYPFLKSNPTFNLGFFDSFDDIFRRFRAQFLPFKPSFVDFNNDNGDPTDVGFKVDPNLHGNSTSTVKIVDGHKVEINDTVYGNDNQMFRVRVVNIKPVDSDEENTVPRGDNQNKDQEDEKRKELNEEDPYLAGRDQASIDKIEEKF